MCVLRLCRGDAQLVQFLHDRALQLLQHEGFQHCHGSFLISSVLKPLQRMDQAVSAEMLQVSCTPRCAQWERVQLDRARSSCDTEADRTCRRWTPRSVTWGSDTTVRWLVGHPHSKELRMAAQERPETVIGGVMCVVVFVQHIRKTCFESGVLYSHGRLKTHCECYVRTMGPGH